MDSVRDPQMLGLLLGCQAIDDASRKERLISIGSGRTLNANDGWQLFVQHEKRIVRKTNSSSNLAYACLFQIVSSYFDQIMSERGSQWISIDLCFCAFTPEYEPHGICIPLIDYIPWISGNISGIQIPMVTLYLHYLPKFNPIKSHHLFMVNGSFFQAFIMLHEGYHEG